MLISIVLLKKICIYRPFGLVLSFHFKISIAFAWTVTTWESIFSWSPNLSSELRCSISSIESGGNDPFLFMSIYFVRWEQEPMRGMFCVFDRVITSAARNRNVCETATFRRKNNKVSDKYQHSLSPQTHLSPFKV